MQSIAGLYWGRLTDVPDGMRVQVWLDLDGDRVRGAYSSMPWNGELEGRIVDADHLQLTFHERGVTRIQGNRDRDVRLRLDRTTGDLAGEDRNHERVELARSRGLPTTLRPGLWLSHWTGLPHGIAVETRLSQMPDGTWRAVYQYQGGGGVRDGNFTGTPDANGTLAIRWSEVAEAGVIARGSGQLRPTPFGFRGSFGIDGAEGEIGEWVLEPFER